MVGDDGDGDGLEHCLWTGRYIIYQCFMILHIIEHSLSINYEHQYCRCHLPFTVSIDMLSIPRVLQTTYSIKKTSSKSVHTFNWFLL